MTVCIGAICDNGKTIVIASDRMWTQQYLSVEFEHAGSKITDIGDCCVLTTAGSVVAPTKLIENTKNDVTKKKIYDISEIANIAKTHFTIERNIRIEDKYFKPRGLTIKEFYKDGVQHKMSEGIIGLLDSKIETFDFQLNILIAGIDDTGGHLYVVFPPGRVESYDRIGYVGIGSGTPHVESTFIINGYKKSWDIKTAVYATYEAKKLAEKAPGVGKKTDIVTLSNEKVPKPIAETLFKELDSIFIEKTKTRGLEDKEIKKKINDLSI